MGATIQVKLSGAARVENIACALSRAAGYTEQPVMRGSTVSPGAVDIIFFGGKPKHLALYHMEYGNGGERGISLPWEAHWLAAAIAVVDAFGGKICANPWDDSPTYVSAGRNPADQSDTGYQALEALTASVAPADEAAIARAQTVLDEIDSGNVRPAVESLLISYSQAPQPVQLYLVAQDNSSEEARVEIKVSLAADAKRAYFDKQATFEKYGAVFETKNFFSDEGSYYPPEVETLEEWRHRRLTEINLYVDTLAAGIQANAREKFTPTV